MPKRIVDGEGLWTSSKLRKLAVELRGEYANLLPLATANGVFEFDPQKIWSKVYSCNRPDVGLDDVHELLEQLIAAGLLFVFYDNNKFWGYWTGIDKQGRLPGPSRRGTHEVTGPNPPLEKVQEYVQKADKFKGIVYFVKAEQTGRIKIGYSAKPEQRLKALQSTSPDKLILIGAVLGDMEDEHKLHKAFENARLWGEWFSESKELSEYIEINALKSMDSVIEVNGINKLLGLDGFGTGIGLVGEGFKGNPSASLSDKEFEGVMDRLAKFIAKRTKYVGRLWPNQKDRWKILVEAFGENKVHEDFDCWIERDWDRAKSPNPLDGYLEVAGNRLEDIVLPYNKEDIKGLSASLYEVGNRVFGNDQLRKLLSDRFSPSEILAAWKELFNENGGEVNYWNVKEFCDGGCEAIIAVRRKREEDRLKQEKTLQEAQERLANKAASEVADADKASQSVQELQDEATRELLQ